MYEVEIKASPGEIPAEEIVEKAKALGFSYEATMRETDTYYNGNDRNFIKTDEALRIRNCLVWHDEAGNMPETVCNETAGQTSLITYKGPKLDETSGTRTEYEIIVNDAETAGNLLDALGYKSVLIVDKVRREFKSTDGVTLCMDEVKGLPPYIELEFLASTEKEKDAALRRLFNILHDLGIPQENTTRKSYLELLFIKANSK